jgi:hypothetical protein
MNLHLVCKKEHEGHDFSAGKLVLWPIAGVMIATVFALLFGWLVQYLWNNTLVSLFSIKTITYWQAVGLLILTRLLVGGLGHRPPHHPPKHLRDKIHRKFHGEPCEQENESEMKKHYHQFWEEKGEKLLKEYLDEKMKNDEK